MCSNRISELLARLRFKNRGTVRRDMRFEYRNRPCYYTEDIEAWSTPWDKASYSYLYEIRDGEAVAPPSGMRSSVPLGGLGAGTVELRADGSLRDWNIFNNSPACGPKVQLDDAFFGLRVQTADGRAQARTLRTHAPRFLPAIEQIEYSGAYPVSRLVFADTDVPLGVTMYACSEFRLRDADRSATPAVIFAFLLTNSGDHAARASLMFNLPNHIGGEFAPGAGLTLGRGGDDPTSGTMAVRASGDVVSMSAMTRDSVLGIWEEFAARGNFPADGRETDGTNPIDEAVGRTFFASSRNGHGALAAEAEVAPGESKIVTFVLSWHLPRRRHRNEVPGNHYATLFQSADHVADTVLTRMGKTLQDVLEWQQLCFDNTLPEWLQDAMVNSVATMAKTGVWFGDGRWRQWESFSCSALDPIHIHFYRVLPYAWFFPSLRRSLLRGYASAQEKDGRIQENLDGERIDQGGGRMMGDAATTFLLGIYQDYLWSADREFLAELWPHAKRAALWQIGRCARFGLPERLDNTYDWWAFAEKDLVAYNAFLHLASITAAERMASVQQDQELAQLCRKNRETAGESLDEHLWTGEHFRAWWMADGSHPDALHADTLYGQLWAEIMGLGLATDHARMRKHLATERTRNDSPFGLKVMQGTDFDDDRHPEAASGFSPGNGGPVNNIVWEAGTLDWCALNIYLGGDLQDSLAEAEKIYRKVRDQLRDQWDIRDLSTGWDGHPWCNSHYARQLMLWAIPLALTGQQYSAVDGVLSFDPRVKAPARLPFMTPTAHGTLELKEGGGYDLSVLCGTLDLRRPVHIRTTGEEVTVRQEPEDE